jgi:hypothetical protein
MEFIIGFLLGAVIGFGVAKATNKKDVKPGPLGGGSSRETADKQTRNIN